MARADRLNITERRKGQRAIKNEVRELKKSRKTHRPDNINSVITFLFFIFAK